MQISLLADNYSLYFNKTVSTDTGEYSCIINDRHSPESIIDLLIQGKYATAETWKRESRLSFVECVPNYLHVLSHLLPSSPSLCHSLYVSKRRRGHAQHYRVNDSISALFYRRTCTARKAINHIFYISLGEFIVGSYAGLSEWSCHRFHHWDKVTSYCASLTPSCANECRTGSEEQRQRIAIIIFFFCFNYFFLIPIYFLALINATVVIIVVNIVVWVGGEFFVVVKLKGQTIRKLFMKHNLHYF